MYTYVVYDFTPLIVDTGRNWKRYESEHEFSTFALYGKFGFTLFFLILLQNIDCGFSLEPPLMSTHSMHRPKKKSVKVMHINFHTISHPEVCIHMLFKISLLIKSLETLITLVRLGTSMSSHMNIQFCFAWETFPANHTSMLG